MPQSTPTCSIPTSRRILRYETWCPVHAVTEHVAGTCLRCLAEQRKTRAA